MARRRSRSSSNFQARRDAFDIASVPFSLPRADLRPYEDRRMWHPERALRPALSFSGRPHRLVVQGSVVPRPARRPGRWPAAGVAFKDPAGVVVCARRRIRREVLLAKGKGGGGHRPPRRSWRSNISCKG